MQQNEVTKKLAGWAAILAVPTVIAGIYGMNFEYMPELRLAHGYAFVMAIIVGACGFLYWRFRPLPAGCSEPLTRRVAEGAELLGHLGVGAGVRGRRRRGGEHLRQLPAQRRGLRRAGRLSRSAASRRRS